MVPEEGIEPSRDYSQGILSLVPSADVDVFLNRAWAFVD